MVDALVLETNKLALCGFKSHCPQSLFNKSPLLVILRYGESGITVVSEATIIGSNPVAQNFGMV